MSPVVLQTLTAIFLTMLVLLQKQQGWKLVLLQKEPGWKLVLLQKEPGWKFGVAAEGTGMEVGVAAEGTGMEVGVGIHLHTSSLIYSLHSSFFPPLFLYSFPYSFISYPH